MIVTRVSEAAGRVHIPMEQEMTEANPSLREMLEAVGSRIRIQRKGTQTYVRIDLAEQAVREWLESEASRAETEGRNIAARVLRYRAKALAAQLGEKDHE